MKTNLNRLGSKNASKTLLLLVIMGLVFTSSPIYYLYALQIDGTVSESEWITWFTDNTFETTGHYTGNLYFTAYWYVDSNYLYIAVKTTDQTITLMVESADEVALNDTVAVDSSDAAIVNGTDEAVSFKPYDEATIGMDIYPYGVGEEDIIFGIQTRSYSQYGYNPYAKLGTSHGSWGPAQPLPTGCAFVAGSTNGYRSYELMVPISLLGLQPGDVVMMAFAIYDRPSYSGQAYNYHPDELLWCNPDNWEPTPPLPIPEIPIGSLPLIATAFVAYFLLKGHRQKREDRRNASFNGPQKVKLVGA